ncbi:MAG TPA: hypothetical protein VM686_06715 [Polyangiaceae bacterium]|nr:hypothetical protein [Polyangiaceae bacterium]
MRAYGLVWLWSFAALACGSAPAGAPPASAAADEEAPEPAPDEPASPRAPAEPAAAARPPAVACDDASAELVRRLEACSNECTAGRIESCEIHGDLQGGANPLENSGFAAPALQTWASACKKGLKTSCTKHDELLKALRERCVKDARTCEVLGSTLQMLSEEHRAEVDKAYERGCAAKEAMACFNRGVLHEGWEPKAEHAALAESAYDRACTLGVQPACCSLATIYGEQGKTAKANAAYNRGEAIKSSKYPRVACDINIMPSAKK